MNILYGSLAIIASLVISNYFAQSKKESPTAFMSSFTTQFAFVVVLGWIFFVLDWGFLADLSSLSEFVKRVGGLGAFLGVLVGMRALNKRKQNQPEAD